jgi:hypothetical protein
MFLPHPRATGALGAPAHAAVIPSPHPQPMVGASPARAQLGLAQLKQHMLAQALRGGMPSGVPQAPPNLGIQRPMGGLPTVR